MTPSIPRCAVLIALLCAIVPSSVSAARRPVIGSIDGPARVAAGSPASFVATYTVDRASAVSASWSWGDGSASAATVSATTISGAHAYSSAGTYTVTLQLNDGRSSTTASDSIVVYNPAPSAAGDAYSVGSNAVLNVPAPGVLANDSDPESRSLSSTLATAPLHGTLALGGDGNFTYSPFPDYSGVDEFTYTAGNGSFTSNAATVTITVGSTPEVEIDDPVTSEGSSLATFTVSLSEPGAHPITVYYATGDGSALAPDDYANSTGSVTFAPGTVTQTITVAVTGDTLPESAETFYVDVTSAADARVRKPRGKCTINDDDGTSPAISIADARQYEGDAGVTGMAFAVTLSAPASSVVTVNYRTFSASATAYEDFVPVSGTVTFAPGTTTSSIVVPINGDTSYEGPEQFLVQLLLPVNAAIGDGAGVGTILNDDGL